MNPPLTPMEEYLGQVSGVLLAAGAAVAAWLKLRKSVLDRPVYEDGQRQLLRDYIDAVIERKCREAYGAMNIEQSERLMAIQTSLESIKVSMEEAARKSDREELTRTIEDAFRLARLREEHPKA